MAVEGVFNTLVDGIIVLYSCHGGVRKGIVTQGGQRVVSLLLLLGHPGVGFNAVCLGYRGTVDAVAAGKGTLISASHPSIAVGWQVLIKLVHIKAFHIGNDIATQLTYVHSTKVNIGLATSVVLNGVFFML